MKIGTPAPNFLLPASTGGQLSPTDAIGKPLLLVFYPADFTPVCTDQLTLYQEVFLEFKEFDIHIWGISADSVHSHRAFAKERKFSFPLLSDFEPKGAAARAYGVYRESDGISERALFLIDSAGILKWSHVSPIDKNPGADGIIRALEAFNG